MWGGNGIMPRNRLAAALRAVIASLACGAAALGVFTPAPVAAQTTGTIAGTVTDADSNQPVADVRVGIQELDRFTYTDAEGRYRFTDVPPGRYTVVTELLGRAPARRTVTVTAGAEVVADFRLAINALSLEQFVVSVSREAQRRSEIAASVGVVSGEALRETRPAHPSEVLGQVPGVWVNQTGGEGHMAAIRQPQTTSPVYLYLEDGVPTRSTGFFNHNALYEINLPQADRLEVIKGPTTALYGSDAVGGIINVSTRAAGPESAIDGAVEGGSYGWRRLLLSASGRTSADGIRADVNFTRSSGWRDATAYDRQTGSLRWDRELGRGSLRTVASFSRIDQGTAGSSALDSADYRNNPTANY